MRATLGFVTVLLFLHGCSTETGPQSDAAAAERTPSASPTQPAEVVSPAPLDHEVLAVMPLESGDLRRVALCGGRYAYVSGQAQVMLVDWRSLTSRVVFETDHSFLYAVRRSTCRFEVFDTVNGYNGEDPSEPGRTLVLDLRTGLYRAHVGSLHEPELPGATVRGAMFTARVHDGHVWVAPLNGGPETRLPGKVGRVDGVPVAHGDLLAYPFWHHGYTRLRVVRIS